MIYTMGQPIYHIVFDLDGTLSLTGHRQHFLDGETKDWDGFFKACENDTPNEMVINMFHHYAAGAYILSIWSGRSDAVKTQTDLWLAVNVFQPENIVKARIDVKMRSNGDYRPDVELKRQWLNEAREKGIAPDLVLDDRDAVVAMWREEGITCFQVAQGDF